MPAQFCLCPLPYAIFTVFKFPLNFSPVLTTEEELARKVCLALTEI